MENTTRKGSDHQKARSRASPAAQGRNRLGAEIKVRVEATD